MRIFRTQKPKAPTPKSPGIVDASMGIGTTVGSRDLSARIEPYTFGHSSTPPPIPYPAAHQPRSASNSSPHVPDVASVPTSGKPDGSMAPPPAPGRRHSLRATSSEEERWVMVHDNPIDSRSSSIASLMPGGAAAPYNSPAFTQTSTTVPNANTGVQQQQQHHPASPIQPQQQQRTTAGATRRPPNSSTPRPEQQQQALNSAQSPPKSNGHPQHVERTHYENQEREGSIHSQQDKSWTRGLFGTTGSGKEREREANAELMRMIGFLTAAAPDDWSLVLEVCDRASASESAAKEASKALRREFKYAEPSAQLSAARLWAIMLQNSSDVFILHCASRKFLDNLEEVINADTTSPVVRERLLDVLASAAYEFGKKPGKEGFATTWRRVRPSWKPPEGVPFETVEGLFDSAFPRRTAAVQPPTERRDDRDRTKRERDRDKMLLQQQMQLDAIQNRGYRNHATPPVPSRKDRGIISPEEDIRRLFEECKVAKENANVLSSALSSVDRTTFATNPVVQEFYKKCRASQELIVAQIPWASAGAERSRIAAMQKRAAKDSGSDGGPQGKLTKRNRDGRVQPQAEGAGDPDQTREEMLLGDLLAANQEIVEVFAIYEQFETMAKMEQEAREGVKRSIDHHDLAQIHLTLPDGSVVTEPPSTRATNSSRSPSPSIVTNVPQPTNPASMPHSATTARVQGGRDLPHPPNQSGDMLNTHPAVAQPRLNTYQQQPVSQSPMPSPMQHMAPQQPPQVQSVHTQPKTQPYHSHHSSNHSVNSAYGGQTLNLPPSAPHGPRQPSNTRSRTPSPDRSGDYSAGSTPPTAGTPTNGMDYPPPSHPPPHLASQGRTESPAPGSVPPGLQNFGGMRIDMDAARGYAGSDGESEDQIMTPIRPSAKALGKRRAEVDTPIDDEELERREEAEMEQAVMLSTIAPGAETLDRPAKPIQYVYDAAAERAKELDAMEREERLRRQQTRSSMQRVHPSAGGGSAAGAAPVAPAALSSATQPTGAMNAGR